MFLDIDKDINGIIDRNEIDLSFRHFDTNNNGRISRLEYTAYVTTNEPTLSPVAHALYDVYDVDNDDQLDHHDFDNFFALMDSDGDHRVTHFEFVRYWTILLADLEHLGNA
nr:putative serine/threonine-protein kinase fhkB [Biomphalaria glabrata]